MLAVGLAQVFETLGNFVFAEDVAVLDRKEVAQRLHVRHRLIVLERDRTQGVTVALLDGHGNVDRLARPPLHQRDMEARMPGIVHLRLGLVDDDFEIAPILIFIADPFRIFVELGGVVRPGEYIFQEDRMRDADGPQVLHSVTQHSRLDVLVAFKPDLTHLDLRAFFDHERDPDRGGRNLPDFRPDRGKLAAVFRQQAFNRHFRFLDFGRIVLILHSQTNLRFLEAVQDVAVGDRAQTDVIDLADGRLFLDLDNQPPTFGSLFTGETDILEVTGVPERVKIALQRRGIVDIPGVRENASLDRVAGNSAVSLDVDLRDYVGLRPAWRSAKEGERDPQRPPKIRHLPAKPCK